jgi:putative holliday junction resolvase
MRQGVRLGVDVGTARVGVARSDRDGLLATPVETVQRRGADLEPVLARIAAIAAELEAIELVVGLPLALSGRETASTADARSVADRLAAGPLPVRMVDERLTTVSAQSALHASGRKARGSRDVIDQVAAVILLQHALDAERARGEAPGALVEPKRREPGGP